MVFSTSVGILFHPRKKNKYHYRILHECGDPIKWTLKTDSGITYSPRVWGSYLANAPRGHPIAVFSTSVGILLTPEPPPVTQLCILHECGDPIIDLLSL